MPNGCACDHSLFARAFHTGLVIFITITGALKNTSLHSWYIEGQIDVWAVLYACLWCSSLVLYFLACLTDPGYVDLRKYRLSQELLDEMENGVDRGQRSNTAVNIEQEDDISHDDDDDDDDDDDEEEDNCNDNNSKCRLLEKKMKRRYCDSCEILPMRSKHCHDCGHCVRRFDHHCPWLGACVGEKNHRFFWAFLLTTCALIIWSTIMFAESIEYASTWSSWASKNLILFIDLLVLVLMGFICVSLFSFHSYLMVKGETTWENFARERITYLKYLDAEYNPFNEGCIRNIYIFLCNCTERRWELIYSIKAKFKKSQTLFN